MSRVVSGPDPSPGSLRIFLVEDSPLLCQVLGELIGEIDGVALLGGADGEATALARLEGGAADLVIVDLELRQGNGFGVLRQLQADPGRFGRPRVIVFSTYNHRAVQQRCAGLGAEAFFDKAQGLDALLDFIQAAVH